jgi:hypothetical protein
VTDLNSSESREGRAAAVSHQLPPGLRPEPGQLAAVAPKLVQTRRDYSPVEMLKMPVFWVMYVMFVSVAAGGLMPTAQLAPDRQGAQGPNALSSRIAGP